MPRRLAAPLLALALLAPSAARTDAAASFAIVDLPTRGRVLDAFSAPDAQGRTWLAALCVEGQPPDEKRFVALFLRGEAGGALAIPISAPVVAVDVADTDESPGVEVLLLEAGRIRVLDARGRFLRAIPLEPALPFPPRSRGLGRLDFARDWHGDGRLLAVLPDLAGLRVVPLAPGGGAVQSLALPYSAIYGDPQAFSTLRDGYFRLELRWPSLAIGDDDGDGVPDLIAATRYSLTVFRGAGAAYTPKPLRVRRLPPFPFEEERRADTSLLIVRSEDLDGDGDADLVAHRTTGTLMGSRAETRVHANTGAGADPLGAPAGTLNVNGGVASTDVLDVDGDGRAELVQVVLPFGMAQAARILVRSVAEIELRVYALPKPALGPPVLRWSDDVSLPFDFRTSRVTALFPTFEGDFNGDGRRDLVFGDDDGNARIRLGAKSGVGFGSVVAQVPIGANGGHELAVDLDGDGLSELVTWDPIVQRGRLRVARNLGRLPGSPPRLAPTPR